MCLRAFPAKLSHLFCYGDRHQPFGRRGTHVTAVLHPERLITGILAHFVCTQHVAGELFAKVVAAFAPSGADHPQHHLLQLVRPGPQVVHGAPAGCLHLCVGAGVGAPLPQVFHTSDGVRGVERSIQLQSRASDVSLLLRLEMKDKKTHFDQSNVVVVIQRVVVGVIVQLQNIKYLSGVLRLAQRMEPQDDLSSVRAEKQIPQMETTIDDEADLAKMPQLTSTSLEEEPLTPSADSEPPSSPTDLPPQIPHTRVSWSRLRAPVWTPCRAENAPSPLCRQLFPHLKPQMQRRNTNARKHGHEMRNHRRRIGSLRDRKARTKTAAATRTCCSNILVSLE